MKIACQSCQAKYTIADEKVLGRVVKIRCKKCGATIVINGNETGDAGGHVAEEQTVAMPSSKAFDYAGQQAEEPWTVNVADGDQRTMTTADLVAQFKAGVVNDETYCWKDGMGDWLPLREIEQLAAACGMGGEAQAPAAQYAPPAAAAGGGGLGALFGGVDAGAYAAPPTETNGNGAAYGAMPAPAAARRAGGRAGGADLFGTAAEAGGENDVMTSAPQGAPAMHEGDASKLVGQRNENSVLFSLNALTQNAPKEETPGPQGDGSGLIDIRALSATMAPQSKRSNHVDDIMNLGGGGAFSAALAAPVLAPPSADAGDVYGAPTAESGKSNKMMFVLIGVGVLIVALLLVVLLRKPETPVATGTTPAGGTATAGSGGPVAANDTSTAPTPTTPPAADSTMGAATPPGQPAPVDPTKSTTSGSTASAGTHKSSSNSSSNSNTSAPAAPVIPPSTGGGTDSLDAMMKKAAGNTGGPSAPPPSSASTAPFDRGAAAGALGAVNVASCKKGDGPTGAGHVSVTFAPDGSVATAVVDQPPFAGTAVGGCVAGKFRGARVPAFAGGSVKVGKSFVIN
jgi:predicted Zn finger-like uncharacterized protein